MQGTSTRRRFMGSIGRTAAAAGWAGAQACAAGASSPSSPGDTINLGLIGCGARGRFRFISAYDQLPGARFVAVCDVNAKHLADGRRRAGGSRVKPYKDYRRLLEDRNVDAVIVATNQQWHALPAIAACQAGKDVYLEKPLGQSIGEGPYVIEAARKYGRIVQAGTQQRSIGHYQKAVEMIQAGALGEISEVKVWDYENYNPGRGSPPDCDPPPELDWDFYVGPSPFQPYNPNIYYHYGYDWFKVAGAGHQVAWGVHHFDVVLWAMGVTAPKAVSATGGKFAFDDNWDYPNTFSATAEFAPGPVARRGFVLQYTMRVGGKRVKRAHGKCFIGTKASMLLDRSGFSIVPEVPRGEKPGAEGMFVRPEVTEKAGSDQLRHFSAFLENIHRRSTPNATPKTLHDATTLGHLMNIAWETGSRVEWDAPSQSIKGNPAAQAMVFRPYRAPWKLSV